MTRRVPVVTVGGAAVLAVAVAVGWVVWQPAGPPPAAAPGPSAAVPSSAETPVASPEQPAAGPAGVRLVVTGSPDRYAVGLAGVLFGMDARTADPGEYRRALLDDADPGLSDRGRADLELTLSSWIPTDDMWARLRANAQWSQWQTGSVAEPGTWQQVVVSGLAEPGWVMRNVTGLQTTHYREAGQWHTAIRERTVSVGMRCPAPGVPLDRCRLVLVPTTPLP